MSPSIRALTDVLVALLGPLLAGIASAGPLSAADRAQLAAGRSLSVIVEVDATAVDQSATTERTRRRLNRDDADLLALKANGYSGLKRAVEAADQAADAVRTRDFQHFPTAVWRLSSTAALNRLLANPTVRAVHRNALLHPVSVSDLPFINQPQTAAEEATGAGTTVAVIDGGLASTYYTYPDFGSCHSDGSLGPACRVVFNEDLYPNPQHPDVPASAETTHGTDVSAISLGVAPGSNLAMFDVFSGNGASTSDILDALDNIISMQATYNIVTVNLSLGDGSSHSSQCGSTGPNGSPFATTMANVKAAGILPVVAAGNSGSKAGLSDPACVQSVVSVGAVYDNSYGSITYPSVSCTDSATAADKVTCFSQSASYLTLLAPGTFVNAPDSSFQQTGTSQATPHVSGSVAVLRARYPAESLDETVQRLTSTGVQDTDAANGLARPRINLLAATNAGTGLSLSGTGPTMATNGSTATYMLKVTNSGPLTATHVQVVDVLPAGATVTSLPSGCTLASRTVTCLASALGVGASITFSIGVRWTVTGPVYDSASVSADQIDTGQTAIAFGTLPSIGADAPLPEWAYLVLALAVVALATRQQMLNDRRWRARAGTALPAIKGPLTP
ncbi:MAG TPA: S8 family serine peptidase [Steroidobacteraceae bacterium]